MMVATVSSVSAREDSSTTAERICASWAWSKRLNT